jgi:hypothetical protein
MQTAESGPFGVYGDMDKIGATVEGVPPGPVNSPNPDSGPSFFYQGMYVPDPRFWYPKDQITGKRGVVAGFFPLHEIKSAGNIPFAVASNNIAAAQNVVSGTPMTLAAASAGITTNIPIVAFSPILNNGVIATAALALDFGAFFCNTTALSGTVTVAAAALVNFIIGMPLVIAGAGNAAGTAPLLCQVTALGATNTITVSPVPQSAQTATPIGTGNLWGPGGMAPGGGPLIPTAAWPFLAAGPGLLFDSGQGITRGVQITGAGGSLGGSFTVRGWDIFGQPMSQTITVGAASTAWSLKTFKYIASVTPNFSDAHNYSVGTSDVFGFNWNALIFENTEMFWSGATITGASATGFLPGVATTPATALTGDVRGTVQVSTNGGGTPLSGGAPSNGTVSSLLMTGNRLEMYVIPSLRQLIYSTQDNASYLFGPTQA